jgi:thioredoxin reductase (NADPH)
MSDPFDCLIIGAGPAGLTAGIYLGRFLRKILILHDGKSRAALIPSSHNFPGFASGLNGLEFLETLRRQAASYGAQIEVATATSLARKQEEFETETNHGRVLARSVILATGVRDYSPEVPGLRGAIYDGQLRYCPICDGYEVIDKNIAIIGPYEHARKKALFLRAYTRQVTLISSDAPAASLPSNIKIEAGAVSAIERDALISVVFADGRRLSFDTIYSALGCSPRSELASSIGAECDQTGALIVDCHQQTRIKRIFAIGDVVSCLDQMSVGIGHAAIAATSVHNSLPTNPR